MDIWLASSWTWHQGRECHLEFRDSRITDSYQEALKFYARSVPIVYFGPRQHSTIMQLIQPTLERTEKYLPFTTSRDRKNETGAGVAQARPVIRPVFPRRRTCYAVFLFNTEFFKRFSHN